MAVFACYIEKSKQFHGAVRPFGNTYHYRTTVGETFDDAAMLDYLKDAEQEVTDQSVKFTRGVTWGPTDGAEIDNVMRETIEWPNEFGLFNGLDIFMENCVLVSWPMPRSVPLNRRRWCRKYLRIGGVLGSTSEAVRTGAAALPATEKQRIIDGYASKIRLAPTSDIYELCNEDGDMVNGDPFVGDYLITRQIGR